MKTMKYKTGGTKDGFLKRNMKELMTEFRDNHEDHGGDQKFYLSNKAFLSFAKKKYNKLNKKVKSSSNKKFDYSKKHDYSKKSKKKLGGFREDSFLEAPMPQIFDDYNN